ncbi:hypothetical protein F5144DRAFT_600981 [Chaetomium tenue]|uniref:Uncharacterized protein n=1 Tax=Chaetomium tenue TaxID=1854479 RepID=A0ACB7PFV4_9PEZI|nr:hypothetical protein F5144DRAFT_600981 [Chaetomium globosum]
MSSTSETMPAAGGHEVPLLSVNVPLIPVAADEGEDGFRVENTSLEDWQREAVIERTGAIDISCDLVGVLHGWLGEESEEGPFATLMVFRFRFDPKKHARRVIRCKATVEFSSIPMPDDGAKTSKPTVVDIAPGNRLEIVPTTDPEEIKHALNVDLALSGVPFLTPSIGGSFERSKRRDNPDATTVSGNISLAPGVNSGPRSCAGWTLLENATRKSGLPDSLRVAVVVKRVDRHSKFKGMFFGSFPIDDPVLFNPDMPPQGVLSQGYSRVNMGTGIDLQSLMDVTFRTEYVGALKKTAAA